MPRLLLLRHAESEWNAQGRWQGIADPPLSPRGEEQARAAGAMLRPMGFSALVSSDLRRALATAQLVAPVLGLTGPIGVDPGLREYDVGAWSGLTRPQIDAVWPGAVQAWREGRLFATPGGEQRDAFEARISAAVARVAQERPAETILVITHGGVIGALCRSLGVADRRFGHLAGLWIDRHQDGLHPGPGVSLLDTVGPVADDGEAREIAQAGVLDIGRR